MNALGLPEGWLRLLLGEKPLSAVASPSRRNWGARTRGTRDEDWDENVCSKDRDAPRAKPGTSL